MTSNGQENAGYQKPPKVMADLVNADPTPAARLSPKGEWMLLLNRPNLPSIEEVAQEELRLAGLRINPATNGSSRAYYYNGIKIKSLVDNKEYEVTGLPKNPRIENVRWSPDGVKIGFTNTTSKGIEMWMLDIASAKAKKLTEAIVNDAMRGIPFQWFSDSKTLICKTIVDNRGAMPEESKIPTGPIIQINEGTTAAVRTYQDLLKNQHDEALFEYFANTQLLKIDTETGTQENFLNVGIISNFNISPDGNYILVSEIKKPFSYIVPYARFPFEVAIFDKNGMKIRQIADIPLADNIPKGFGAVRTGARSFTWRADKSASLYWVEAQDGGDPKKEAEIRDRLFHLDAPFKGDALADIDFKLRFGGLTWGDSDMALAQEWWWQNRQLITSRWQPDATKKTKTVWFDRSWEDRYNNPGNFEVATNDYGRAVLLQADKGNSLYLMGQGASPEGNRPFVDKFDIKTQKTERLWRSEAPYYEYPIQILDKENGVVLTRRESNEEPPNYYKRNLKGGKLTPVTSFENPYLALKDVKKELIKYKRADGVELTGTLYLPGDYDKEKDGPLPTFMWAYPREFKSKDAAGQVTNSPYEFIRLSWGSPLYWVTQGYAIFNNFSMPIIGEGEEEPNETFVEQLSSGAEAAVNQLVEMGVTDRNRIGVGGHSYGAFMTANLLAHTDLFAAGIARSGAYNRTLTPFGFQSEERTFWEAPEIYFKMSPFMHADKIKEPLLLIHGEADNNSGTFPMQSERFYSALKGHGATVRLCQLPHESHGYRAKESVLHTLWEMTEWLDKYVKKKESNP